MFFCFFCSDVNKENSRVETSEIQGMLVWKNLSDLLASLLMRLTSVPIIKGRLAYKALFLPNNDLLYFQLMITL